MMILDVVCDNEHAVTSNVEYFEEAAERIPFVTTSDNCEVTISVNVPFTIHQGVTNPENGAFRLYLDGTARNAPLSGGKQWNGLLLLNAGAWCEKAGIPVDGRLSGVVRLIVPTAGEHALWLQYAGSKCYTIGTLRGRRRYQIW